MIRNIWAWLFGVRMTAMDQPTATALGFSKQKYMAVERERRWLCRTVPRDRIVQTDSITDIYTTGARLRLRETHPAGGAAPIFRLTRKADVDARTHLITTIYFSGGRVRAAQVFASGPDAEKTAAQLQPPSGFTLSVDQFRGTLGGLLLAEAESESPRGWRLSRCLISLCAKSPTIRATPAPAWPKAAFRSAFKLKKPISAKCLMGLLPARQTG